MNNIFTSLELKNAIETLVEKAFEELANQFTNFYGLDLGEEWNKEQSSK